MLKRFWFKDLGFIPLLCIVDVIFLQWYFYVRTFSWHDSLLAAVLAGENSTQFNWALAASIQ